MSIQDEICKALHLTHFRHVSKIDGSIGAELVMRVLCSCEKMCSRVIVSYQIVIKFIDTPKWRGVERSPLNVEYAPI